MESVNWQTLAEDPTKYFDRREELAHVATHILGFLFIIVMFNPLVAKAVDQPWMVRALLIYAMSFGFVFAASSVYHSAVSPKRKPMLRKLDHIAIYYFILGSNAPFLLGLLPMDEGLPFFVGMFILVLLGTIYKVSGTTRWPWFSLFFYLLLGWLGLVTVWLIYDQLPALGFRLIFLGGVLYTIGVYFYANDQRRWYHTIWHLFVLAAAFSHFAAIWVVT